MYGAPHGEYIQVWTPEQLPVARKIQEKNYIKEDAQIYAASASVNYESNCLPVGRMSPVQNCIKEDAEVHAASVSINYGRMSTQKNYNKEDAEIYATNISTCEYQTPVKPEEYFHDNTFSINEGVESDATSISTDDNQTPVKLEEPLEAQSDDKQIKEENMFDISTATTDQMMAIIKKQAAKAEKAKAGAEKRKEDSEDARKMARRLKKNEAKRRRRRNMSDEKRQLEREKNVNRSRKWRARKKLEKQKNVEKLGEKVLAALKLEVQKQSAARDQEVVQAQSPAQHIISNDNTHLAPSNMKSIIPTRVPSLETLRSFMPIKKRVTKLLSPEQLEQRREVYRRLPPEQKQEHNRKVMERRKQRIEEMTEEEKQDHDLKEYVKYVERYRKRKEKMKNDTPEERIERLKEWRESKRRTREKKKLQQQGSSSGGEIKLEVEDQVADEEEEKEEVQFEDISLCYGNYIVQTNSGSYEETVCQLDATADIYGYDVMNQESSELKYL